MNPKESDPEKSKSQTSAPASVSDDEDQEDQENVPRRARPRTILLAVGVGLVATICMVIFLISDRLNTFDGADRITELLDHLSPRYIKSLQRVDLWGKELEYQGSATSYRLISYGPDRKSGTKDDLIIENGALKTGAN